jgi:hypothetical protein
MGNSAANAVAPLKEDGILLEDRFSFTLAEKTLLDKHFTLRYVTTK